MNERDLLDRVRGLSTCGVLALDPQDTIVHVSGVVEERLRSLTEQAVGWPLAVLGLPAETLNKLSLLSKEAFATRERISTTMVMPLTNAPHLWALTFNPSYNLSGRPDVMVISLYEVGGRLKDGGGAKELAPTRDTGCLFLPGSVVALSRADLTFEYLNKTALASLGVDKEEVIGRRIGDVLHDGSGGLLEMIHKVAEKKETLIHTEAVSLEGLGVRYFRSMLTPTVLDGAERINLMVADVTDRMLDNFKEMSSGMFQEQQMLQTIIDTIPIGMIVADREGNVWHSNALANHLWSGAVNKGRSAMDLLECVDTDDQGQEREKWPLYRALHDNVVTIGQEVRVRVRSGDLRTLMTSAAPLRSDDDSLLGAVILFLDVSDQKVNEDRIARQTEELKRSNEELQQFAYVASHDLKEPLRMVVSYVQLLNKHYGDRLDGKGQEYMRYATEGAQRMKLMIDDLLEYSRVGSDREQSSPVDMEEVLDEVEKDLGVSIAESGASIVRGQMPTINVVKTQMVKLIENLVSNSIKYRDVAAPHIDITARRAGMSWLFSIKDNGIGIDPKYGDRLFKMFQRLHTKDEYPGTGMGLALARRIVERHGGSIWFESEIGAGTTFFFTIPLDSRVRGRQTGSIPQADAKEDGEGRPSAARP